MNKDDKQILDLLRGEFEKSAEKANVPLPLQKESIVNMLKNEKRKEKDFSDKTGTKNNSIVILRRLTAVAAMLTIVVIGALAMRMNGVRVIRTDSFYKSYESGQPIKNAKSYQDVEEAVREILGEKASPAVTATKPSSETQLGTSPNLATTAKTGSLLEGYESFVASSAIDGSSESVYSEGYSFNNTYGVSGFGDFEADIVKNDGEFLYIVTTGTNRETGSTVEQIKIVKAVPAEEMRVVSTVTLSEYGSSDSADECIEIYLKGSRLVALINRGGKSTAAIYYDISKPENPVKIREHVQDGSYISSSLHENRLCLVTDKPIYSASGELNLVPSFSADGETVSLNAKDIFIAVNDPEASYIFITVTDISNFDSPVGRLAILGSGKQLYCSVRSVSAAREFVSVDADDSGEHKSLTEIYRFNLDGTSIAFAGSYIVEGSLIGGLSIDESNGYMRAATSGTDSGNIYVLDNNMKFVSGLKKILQGENVSDIRFMGSSVYFVAEGETMIIDLSDPAKPKVAATIQSTDFSGSLHAISDKSLLGIGFENGNVTFSLMDISDSDNPKTVSEYALGNDYNMISSGDLRSVINISGKSMFGIPVIKHDSENQTDISAYMLFEVSNGEIKPRGTFNHDESYIGDAAVRSACIGDVLYTVSGEKVAAFSIESGKILAVSEIR